MTLYPLPSTVSGDRASAAERLRAALQAAADALVELLTEDESGTSKPAGVADRLLTVAEVAKRTGLSADYIYRHGKRWPFARRIGRAVRFSEAGLEHWLANRRPTA